MNTTIIALAGPMGSGKSEAIKLLKNIATRDVILVKFAQPLYDIQEYIYDRVSDVHVRSSSFVKDRLLLQWLGTEWGRGTIDKDLWVKLWIAAVEDARRKDPSAIIVCDDCRFDNEAEVVKSIGGIIVKISTSRNGERIDTSRAAHASESGISDEFVHYIVENNGTLEEYQGQLNYLFGRLGLKGGSENEISS